MKSEFPLLPPIVIHLEIVSMGRYIDMYMLPNTNHPEQVTLTELTISIMQVDLLICQPKATIELMYVPVF